MAVLRETHYAQIMESGAIPASAESIYSQNDTLRKYVANLDLTVRWYNKVRQTVLQVEYPLIEGQLADLDGQLQRAETSLHWKDDGQGFDGSQADFFLYFSGDQYGGELGEGEGGLFVWLVCFGLILLFCDFILVYRSYV